MHSHSVKGPLWIFTACWLWERADGKTVSSLRRSVSEGVREGGRDGAAVAVKKRKGPTAWVSVWWCTHCRCGVLVVRLPTHCTMCDLPHRSAHMRAAWMPVFLISSSLPVTMLSARIEAFIRYARDSCRSFCAFPLGVRVRRALWLKPMWWRCKICTDES